MDDISSKSIDGITDLVVIAPIKDGFIEAYENVTYATRLKLVAEALNRVRVSAREHERVVPYSDVTERILSLLDFRIGVLDKDVVGLAGKAGERRLESRRYLYLTATFDGAWEPYMRLIWDPLGPFLDLLFCNCEGYVTATEHSFEEYAQWVRDNQMDSAIFYATTGLTIRDHLYLSKLERLQRAGADDLTLATTTMPDPETMSAQTRVDHWGKTLELGLEAMTVLYKLADYYPPEWMTGAVASAGRPSEGHRLVRVAHSVLKGWDRFVEGAAQLPAWPMISQIYKEPLTWYNGGKAHLDALDAARNALRKPDPEFTHGQVQGGIVRAHGSAAAPVQHGALLLFTVRNATDARAFIAALNIHYEQLERVVSADGLYRTIGFTPQGLVRLGVDPELVEQFPKEFREGMAARSGLIGDMRENHPRNWILPVRNGPELAGAVPPGTRLPPVELGEVDFVVEIRSTVADAEALRAEVVALAQSPASGATLQSVEWMQGGYDAATGMFRDHFGYLDGISQPRPNVPLASTGKPIKRDEVRSGEIVLGYGNDRSDAAPGAFGSYDPARAAVRDALLAFQRDGSFWVVRKIGQDVAKFDTWLIEQSAKIAVVLGCSAKEAVLHLKAAIMGRTVDGQPLIPVPSGHLNDFDYKADEKGMACPFAAHIRRANPRTKEFERPTPRLLRRGMLFDDKADDPSAARGMMFMAYNASIAEQYEAIQRWLNGGNSTDIASAHNDPLTGVQPKGERGVFRFVIEREHGPLVVRVELPEIAGSAPGRHPFTPLHWGLYLFAPSRSGIAHIVGRTGSQRVMNEPVDVSVGLAAIERVQQLDPIAAGMEWKRLLEDFDVKDPGQQNIGPDLWAAIRAAHGGVLDLRRADGTPGPVLSMLGNGSAAEAKQNVILCVGPAQVRQVLAEWENFSSEEQLRRIAPNSGPIFVTQQPDNVYATASLRARNLDYPAESKATNAILLAYDQTSGFTAGYTAGLAALAPAKAAAAKLGRTEFKLELRRQYLLPALGELCKIWYGLPDGTHMAAEGWSWKEFVDAAAGGTDTDTTRTMAHCPGDFLSPSRNAFYPRPTDAVRDFAQSHGTAILKAAEAFVAHHRPAGAPPQGSVAAAMFSKIPKDDVLARNLIGTMVGAIPPMDGNLRGIILEWLSEKTLWRHQAALRSALQGQRADAGVAAAIDVLYGPIAQAMCKRPAPDLLYRTARADSVIRTGDADAPVTQQAGVAVKEGDLVIVSLVSASQASLDDTTTPDGDVSIVFGGQREKDGSAQGYVKNEDGTVLPDPAGDHSHPVHACPAQDMAMGAIMGIMAALLDAGTIQALPASMIVRISDW